MDRTVQANAVITLNLEPARQKVDEFSGLIEKAKKELDELNSKPVDLRTEAEKKRIKELTDKEIPRLEKQLDKAKENLKNFRDTLQHLDKASINDLTNAKKALNEQIRRLTPGTKEYIASTEDFKKVNERLSSLNAAYRQVSTQQQGFFGTIKGAFGWFNKYWGGLTMLGSALTGLSTTFRKCAESAAKLDDVYADVMKTTGLLHEQVVDLDKELMQIDTRTSREQLLLLARDAGKLGIQGKEDILGFVRAADQIQVALGEDLGEGAIKNLGKIADVFGLTKEMGIEKSLLSIASAVNALGQASTASEAYLIDFTQRLAGVGAMAGLSVQDILGFASGLDQSAMKVEMAATAFQKFLMKMYEDTATFAGYAGMEVEEFSELLKTNANEAITSVMKTMNGQDGFASLVPMFDQMGLDGARAVTVLASMTQNLDAVTEAQRLANVEFAKGTSVTEEYTTKNNNLQAQLEKARKEFHNASVALGQSLNPIMLKSTKATTYLIKALASYGKEIRNAAIAVGVLTLAIKVKNIAQGISNALDAASITLTKTKVVVVNLAKLAYFKLTSQTEAAAVAQAALNGAMNASVFGLIATVVTGLTVAITRFVKKQREAKEEAEALAEIEKRVSEEYGEQAGKVHALTAIVENNNIALSERKKALEELKRIVPGYHGDLTEEGRLINSNKVAIDEYCKSLREQIRLEARKDKLLEIEKQIAALEDQRAEAEERKYQALVASGGDTTEARMTKGSFWKGQKAEFTDYGQANFDIKNIDSQLEPLYEQEKKISDTIGKIITDPIDKIKAEYETMFDQIRKESVDDPKAAEVEIKRLTVERDLKIEELKKTTAETKKVVSEENAILTQAQFDYLQERQDKLTKKEKELVTKGYTTLSEEESKTLKTRYEKLTKIDTDQSNKRYQAEVKRIEQSQREEQNVINRQLFEREITTGEHEEKLVEIKVKYLEEKKALAEKYGQDTSTIEQQLLTAEVERHKFYYDKELKLSETRRMEEERSLREQLSTKAITQEEFDQRMLESREKYLREHQELALGYNQDADGIQLKDIEARQKEEEAALKRHLTAQEITQEEYDSRMIEIRLKYLQQRLQLAQQSGQDETTILQAILDAQVEAEDLALQQMQKLKEEAKDVMDSLRSPSEVRNDELDAQLERLDVLHAAMLLSEEQYEEAVKRMRKKYADEDLKERLDNVAEYIGKANELFNAASNFVTALKEAESAKLEAEYQAQLTAAGDNAEKREQIEAEYEQKKLDLQKKYADVDMSINIAKAVASGALAAVEAFAAAGGNPVLGAVFAALIAATTAAEVATIIAQRNAIKNASVGSSSSSSPNTGTRTVTGYSEGGYTEQAASDEKEVGVIHANEWVAPAWMVRRNPKVFANLERYRKEGEGMEAELKAATLVSARKKSGKGFAEGGYTGSGGRGTLSVTTRPERGNDNSDDIDWQAMREFNATMRYCAENGLFVKYGDIKKAADTEYRFKSQTTRG